MASVAQWDLIDRCLSVPADVERCRRILLENKPDWLAIVSAANDRFVGPALWTTLSQPRLRELVPDDARVYFELIYARNAERNVKLRRQCIEIGAAFAAAGLRAVLLKGAAWIFDHSGSPAADRMMRDIDLLVAPGDVEAAVHALISSGYHDTKQMFREEGHLHYEERGHFHRAPLMPPNGEAIVEIHRDIAYRTDLLPAREMIEASMQVAPGLLLPAVHHRLLHNAIHAQFSNSDRLAGRFDVREGHDLALLIQLCETQFDWQAFAEEARRHNCFTILSGALHAAHRILGSPLPPPFAADRWGRWHGWRCQNQRRWPVLARSAALLGKLEVALNWDRDAYAFNLKDKPTVRDQVRVNLRRGLRVSRFFGRSVRRRLDLFTGHVGSRPRFPDKSDYKDLR